MSSEHRCSGTVANGGPCTKDAKWWYRDTPTAPWTPRCGLHGATPPFSHRERKPISANPPESH